jgi:signal peptidase I
LEKRHWIGIAGGIGAIAAVAALWLFLAPRQLGGDVSYAVIDGSSMAPRLRSGDLAILRVSPSYRVGDVAAYRSSDLHRIVLHRIVGKVGAKFAFKGDGNTFLDASAVEPNRVVGKLWVRVPGGGHVLAWPRDPIHAAILGALIGLLTLGGGTGVAVRRRRRRRRELGPVLERHPPRPSVQRARNPAPVVAVVLGVAAIAFLAFTALAFSRDAVRHVIVDAAYTERGAFSYSASGPAGPVYGGKPVATGDPVFLRLIDTVRVQFDWRARSVLAHRFTGDIALSAQLGSPQGWRRQIALQPTTVFDGDAATAAGVLRLDRLRTMTAAFERLTGVHNETYTVTVQPRVRVAGIVGGQSVRDTFAPTLALQFDKLQLAVKPPDILGAGPPPDPFTVSKSGSVPASRPDRIQLWHAHVSIPAARQIGLVGVVGSLLAALVVTLFLLVRREDEVTRIERRYGDWLVPVAADGAWRPEDVVEVARMEGLVQLADRYERMILHEVRGGRHSFLVEEAGIVYRYEPGRRAGDERIPTEPELERIRAGW